MPTPRRLLVDRAEPGYYHCISRCVRQAFLCGGEFEARKSWIQERARVLTSIFAIDVCAVGVLSNHYHVIVRTDPDTAGSWTDAEVRERWKRLYPRSGSLADGVGSDPHGTDDGEVTRESTLRHRLSDLSWFMRALNEYIARRANRDEGRTGRFWEGRFKSIRLLDEEALLQCAIYVDLNEIRAGVAETPETSSHSSVHTRIRVKQLHEYRRGERSRAPQSAPVLVPYSGEMESRRDDAAIGFRKDELGIWLEPVEREPARGSNRVKSARRRRGMLDVSVNTYLELVDAFGRIVRAGRGAIPVRLKPILQRVSVDVRHATSFLTNAKRLYGTVAGAPDLVRREAVRRGRSRAVSVLRT